MVPRMQAVESSAVARIGYDERAEEVYVEFVDDGTYAYRGVPPWVWNELEAAESKGTFVNRVLKPNCPCRKID